MKFVCEKCKTKYSIADEKVRRKVLKIRCKNCGNIIVVRDPSRGESRSAALSSSRREDPLEQAFDGAFGANERGARRHRASSGHRALAVARAPQATFDDVPDDLEEEEEHTRVSEPIMPSKASPVEDEWYLSVDGHEFGPMSFDELGSRVKRGEARGDEAYVWRDGFDDWLEVSQVPELRPFAPPPPPPPQRSGLFPASDIEARLQEAPEERPSRITGASVPAGAPISPGGPGNQAGAGNQAGPGDPGGAGNQAGVGNQAGAGSPPLPPAVPVPVAAAAPPVVPAAPTSTSSPTTVPPTVAPASGASLPASASPAPPASASPVTVPSPPLAGALGAVPGPLEAGLRQLPASYGDRPDMNVAASLMPAASPSGGKTPALIKIAAIAGILSTLTGVAILVYFLFIERPTRRGVTGPDLHKLASAKDPAATPSLPTATEVSPDAGAGATLEFPPVDVARSPRRAGHRGAQRHPAKGGTKLPKTPKGKKLTDAERRLLARMGGNVGAAKVPTARAVKKRVSRPSREISSSEVTALQRRHHSALNACYQRALKRDDSLKEVKAVIRFDVAPSGVLRAVRVTGVDDYSLRTCLKRTIKRWVFKPIGGREAKTIEMPLLFHAG